jgi:hypothetical protein
MPTLRTRATHHCRWVLGSEPKSKSMLYRVEVAPKDQRIHRHWRMNLFRVQLVRYVNVRRAVQPSGSSLEIPEESVKVRSERRVAHLAPCDQVLLSPEPRHAKLCF